MRVPQKLDSLKQKTPSNAMHDLEVPQESLPQRHRKFVFEAMWRSVSARKKGLWAPENEINSLIRIVWGWEEVEIPDLVSKKKTENVGIND